MVAHELARDLAADAAIRPADESYPRHTELTTDPAEADTTQSIRPA
jgi:hypothetical protein